MTLIKVGADLLSTDEQGSVANWFFEDGATVREGDLLCEVMVEKVTLEVRAPVAGRITILAPTETVVTSESVLAKVE